MNILMVTLGYYPAEAWGGPVKVVRSSSRELVRRGHRITVYCTNLLNKNRTILPGTFERHAEGVRVVYFKTWRVASWPGTLGPYWLPHLPAYLNREIRNFDIVHLHGYRSFMSLPVIRSANRAGVPVVMQPHGSIPVVVNSQRAKRLYDRLYGHRELAGISALIALQESERRQALAAGVPPEKVVVIPNGVDLTEWSSLPEPGTFRRKFGIPSGRLVVLFLARINRKKGADMLVKAFSSLGDLNAYLIIAGPDDGQLAEVKGLVGEYYLDGRVLFTGLLQGMDLLAAYLDSDLFALPCRTDTFPFTLMEACVAGKPIVVTDTCEIAPLLKGCVAEVVPFDPQAFAAAIRRLLTDPELYARYQANTSSMVRDHFSLPAVIDAWEALYRRMIQMPRV